MYGFLSKRPSLTSNEPSEGPSPLPDRVKKEEERMYHHCGCGNTPNKIFHGECYPFLQESKQEPPGPGRAVAHRHAREEMTETGLGVQRVHLSGRAQ